MRLNPIYTLQSITGEHFIFIRKGDRVDMTRIISLSASAAWLWSQLEGCDFTCDDAISLLTEHYEVENNIAVSDVQQWLDFLSQNALLL